MDSTRQNKISKQIQKDLSEIIAPFSRNLLPGKMVTITKVRVTPDLGLARIYISIFPSDKSQDAVDVLNLHLAPMRNELGRKIRHQVRIIPELKFFLDDSLDYIENIDNLLNKKP
jgi:ribosome-binding factor A